MSAIALSALRLDPEGPQRRESPRPPELRNATYAAQFDWHTLFYDVYRVGDHVVFQGPPLRNLLEPLRRTRTLARWPGWLPGGPRHVARDKRGELWWRSPLDRIVLDGPLGHHEIAVQPDMAGRYAGRRVLHTLSKDNPPRWIRDWIAFHASEHGADAVLLYDNGSTAYTAPELEAELRGAFPAMVVDVISWPFPYGPQGGLAGAVDGREAPWDSDFCQTGSLQHARFRFLREARSVLNLDIDELVLDASGRSIFAAAEDSPDGFVKFPGRWIASAAPRPVDPATCRHADFDRVDPERPDPCPPKWCVVPARCHPFRHSWSVHNLFGAPANRVIDRDFVFRHMKPISNAWKERRWDDAPFDPARHPVDEPLRAAFARAALPQSAPVVPGP